MKHLAIRLTGRPRAQAQVLQHLTTLPLLGLPLEWSLRGESPRCELREGSRAVVASTWEACVDIMLRPPTPLCEVVVRGPGRWRGR